MRLLHEKTYTNHGAAIKGAIAAFSKGDLDGAIAPYAEDAERWDPTGTYKGTAQILAALKGWHTAFPDARGDVTNQVSEGDQVVTEVIFRGTHTGPLAGMLGTVPATGKKAELRYAFVSSFRNGKIQSERNYFDLAGLMQQLGSPQSKN